MTRGWLVDGRRRQTRDNLLVRQLARAAPVISGPLANFGDREPSGLQTDFGVTAYFGRAALGLRGRLAVAVAAEPASSGSASSPTNPLIWNRVQACSISSRL